MTFAPVQNRLGVQPVGTTVTCVNKSGTSVAIGDLVITSFIHAGAVVDPQQAANTGYVFNCIRKAVSTETGNTGYLGVVTGLMTGAGANGREVAVQFGGICSAKVLVTATVTPGTLLGVSTTAGVLTNSTGVMSAGGFSVTLMDNAAVADGTALKRVYIPQEYTFDTGDNAPDSLSVYGSNRPRQFLKDVIAGTDSLDIILLGDSNVGSALAGSYGYQAGMSQALDNLNATCYGTPIVPFIDRSASGANRFYGTWRGTIATLITDTNFRSGLSATVGSSSIGAASSYASWNTNTVLTSYGSSTIQGTLTGVTLVGTAGQFTCTAAKLQVNQQLGIYGTIGTAVITGYTNPTTVTTAQTYYIVATNGSTEFTISNTYGGPPVVTATGTTSGLIYLSQADFNDWLYFDPAQTPSVSGYLKATGISVDNNHPLAVNNVSQRYRIRYGKVAGSTGGFFPNVNGGGSANNLTRIWIQTTAVPFAGTPPTFDVYEGPFTANGKGHTGYAIGYNTNGTLFSCGPGALFCQSFYRPATKGWSVHNHAYQSGDDSTRIALLINDTSTTWLQLQLTEIRERQLAAGGSGRVMLFFSSGINGADTATTWTNAHTSVWNRYKAVWASLGYPATDLAIVSSVGVQKDLADLSGSGANLSLVRTAANEMATASSDMTVVDVKKLMSYSALTYGTGNASYYQRFNNSPNQGSDIVVHLSGGAVTTTGTFTTSGATSFPTATTITLTGTSAVTTDGYWIGSVINIGTMAITVASCDAAGNFACTNMAGYLLVNQAITVTGTSGGPGSITGYPNTATTYYIKTVNSPTAVTAFTLSLTPGGATVGTGNGALSGLTFTYLNAPTYQGAIITAYRGDNKQATVSQWNGGAPPTGHSVNYTIGQKYPSDGYTVVSQAIISALIS